MRWMDKPPASACSICSRHGSHKLAGPPRPAEPVCGSVAGFDAPASPEPVCGVAGFEIPAKYLPTVPRSSLSSRAIRRPNHPLLAQGDNALLLIHFELIHRPKCSRNRNTQYDASPQKWLVLTRNSLAGFARNLTIPTTSESATCRPKATI